MIRKILLLSLAVSILNLGSITRTLYAETDEPSFGRSQARPGGGMAGGVDKFEDFGGFGMGGFGAAEFGGGMPGFGVSGRRPVGRAASGGPAPAFPPAYVTQTDEGWVYSQVHCLVRIDAAESLQITQSVLEALLNSPFLRTDVGYAEPLHIQVTDYGRQLFLIQLLGQDEDAQLSLEEGTDILEQVCEGLERALMQLFDDMQENLREQLEYFERQSRVLHARLDDFHHREEKIRKETGRFNLSAEVLNEQISDLEQRMQQNQLDHVKIVAVREALQQQIGKLQEDAGRSQELNQHRRELEVRLAQIHEKRDQLRRELETMNQLLGDGHQKPASIRATLGQLSEEIHALELRHSELEGVTHDRAVDRLFDYQAKLAEMSLKETELEVTRVQVVDLLAELQQQSSLLSRHHLDVVLNREILHRRYIQLEEQRMSLEQHLELLREPEVILLSGLDDEPADHEHHDDHDEGEHGHHEDEEEEDEHWHVEEDEEENHDAL